MALEKLHNLSLGGEESEEGTSTSLLPFMASIVIVGAGIFGLTTALSAAKRGLKVTVVEAGPVPNPWASSTDVTKMIRAAYGEDALYTAMAEASFPLWKNNPHYHETGLFFASLSPNGGDPSGFVLQSAKRAAHIPGFRVLNSPDDIAAAYPAWSNSPLQWAYFDPRGGWANSAAVLSHLAEQAKAIGVTILDMTPVSGFLRNSAGHVTGVACENGLEVHAEKTLIAAGAWTPTLLPELKSFLPTVAQTVFLFRPQFTQAYRPGIFPAWGADIAKTGFYGFPVTPEGIVKVSNHGPGEPSSPPHPAQHYPDDEAHPDQTAIVRLGKFIRAFLPSLAGAPVKTRKCWYSDSYDGHFIIDSVPGDGNKNLYVAAGGSGHGFKFAPILGDLIADIVYKKPNRFGDSGRFTWPKSLDQPRSALEEAARAKL